jgi:HD superfamily phosphodiesterase
MHNNKSFLRKVVAKDKMNTVSGKKIAQERHRYMEGFLAQFTQNGKNKENRCCFFTQ